MNFHSTNIPKHKIGDIVWYVQKINGSQIRASISGIVDRISIYTKTFMYLTKETDLNSSIPVSFQFEYQMENENWKCEDQLYSTQEEADEWVDHCNKMYR